VYFKQLCFDDVKILISECNVCQLKCMPKPVCPNTCHWRIRRSWRLLLLLFPNKSVGTKLILHTALPINFILFAAVQTNLLRSCTKFDDVTVTARASAIPNDIFRGVPHFLQEDAGAVPPLSHDRFLPNPFQIINHRSSYYFTLYDMILRASYNISTVFTRASPLVPILSHINTASHSRS
jgi:hypothetical protein